MGVAVLIRRAAVAVLLVSGVASHASAQFDVSGAPRATAPLTILQINDVYSTVPIEGRGGLARVATIKRQVEAAGGRPLLMLAGDFLSSSVTSTVFQGEQMIATLNATGLDYATLGNHEFDFGIEILLQRMAEARWTWVIANVVDRQTGGIVGGAAPYVVREYGSLTVGIIGLCIADDTVTGPAFERVQVLDPIETAAKYLPEMRAAGADVIVALTHLAYGTDRILAERFPEIDVIVGGHEHYPITSTVGRTLISKAGTEARYVARIDVMGGAERHIELMEVDASIAEDPETARIANEYEAKLDAALEHQIATTSVPLDGVGAQLRTSETNLGNLVADAMRAAVGAEIGLVNGGGIRGDRVYPAGPLTRRNMLEIHPFGNVVCRIDVPGRVLLAALEHGLSSYPVAAGAFPQVSGLTLRVDRLAASGSRARDVLVNGTPLDPNRIYTVAVPSFLLEGGDGYDAFKGQRVAIGPESGPTITSAIEQFIRGKEIAPQVEGRVR